MVYAPLIILILSIVLFSSEWLCVESSRHTENVTEHPDTPDNETRVYFMKRVSGPGCPYTASWLADINLYRKVKYWIDITKMEAATFTM